MSDAGAGAMAAGKSRRMAGLVMLLVALGGGVAGVALDRLVFLPMHFGGRPFGRGGPPGEMEHRMRDHFANEVGLSPEQKQKVDSLIERQMTQFRTVRSEMQPRIDTIFQETRKAIDSILTPEQRAKAAELMRRRGGRIRGPGGPDGPGDRGPGGPGGPGDRQPPPPPQ